MDPHSVEISLCGNAQSLCLNCADQNSRMDTLPYYRVLTERAISGRSNLGPAPTSFQLDYFCLSFGFFQRIETRPSVENSYQGQEVL